MPNLSSPASTQTDFFDIFSKKTPNFTEELLNEFQKNPNLSIF
jgi:hypothetical protein